MIVSLKALVRATPRADSSIIPADLRIRAGQRHTEGLGELADRRAARAEPFEHGNERSTMSTATTVTTPGLVGQTEVRPNG